MVHLKAGGITPLSDARYFAARGVEWLGFCMDQDAVGGVTPAFVEEVKNWISGPGLVGEFHSGSPETIASLALELGLDGLQLGPGFDYRRLGELPDSCTLFTTLEVNEMKPVRAISHHFESSGGRIAYVVLPFTSGAFPLSETAICELGALIRDFPMYIELPAEGFDLLEHLRPRGICLKGSGETRPGWKTFDAQDALFARLEEWQLRPAE